MNLATSISQQRFFTKTPSERRTDISSLFAFGCHFVARARKPDNCIMPTIVPQEQFKSWKGQSRV